MKKLLILLCFFVYLHADSKKEELFFKTIEEAIANYEKMVIKYENNIYFYSDDKGYYVVYDPEAKPESDYSFLQILNSDKFEDVIVEYRKMWDKKDLYIKKFYQLYFLRISNKDIKHTQKMFLELQKKFPNIYLSKKPKKEEEEELEDLSHSKVVFLKDRLSMMNTDPIKDIIVSSKKDDTVPSLKNDYDIKTDKIQRKSNIEVLSDLENSVSNFGVVRGDILGLKNAGLYDLGTFNNYGILCKTSESLLFLVSKNEISSIYDLRGKTISTGSVNDIAQIYLKNGLTDTGVLDTIRFRAMNVDDSLKALEKKEIDLFFMFAPKDYIYKFLKKGFYISSIPTKIRESLNKEQGLEVVKYKIDERVVLTYQTPKFSIAPLTTLDTNIVQKIEVVAKKFGCFENMKIPPAFFGAVHPEFLKAYEAARLAALEKQKQNGIAISFVELRKYDAYKDYIYKVSNDTNETINVDFEYIDTKYFDDSAVKAHHILKLNTKSDRLSIDPKSEKIISFKYQNNFALRVNDLKVDLIFRDTRFADKKFVLPLVIGDNQ